MTLRNRFLLVGFGIFVFVVATPILVLYARGFQIDWIHHKLVKTGSLVIKTLPTKATVVLNGKKQKTLTPDTIRFILPGDYDIQVQKDGYQTWSKRLPINSQFATWVNENRDFITLFLAKPVTVQTIPVSFSSVSKSADELAYLADNRISIYNINNNSNQQLGSIGDFHVPFTFTGSVVWQHGADVYKFFSKNSTNLPIDPAQIKKNETDGNFMVLQVNDQLYSFNGTLKLLDNGVRGFSLDGENLWYISGTSLKTYNLRTNATSAVVTTPAAATAQIIRGEGNTFLILDRSLYVLNDTLEKIYDGVDTAAYDTNSHMLMFANSNEILIYNPQQKTTNLILRSISPVTDPVLNSYTGYVFFENENQVKAIELDGRDHRNIYTLTTLSLPNTHIALDQQADSLILYNDSQVEILKIR